MRADFPAALSQESLTSAWRWPRTRTLIATSLDTAAISTAVGLAAWVIWITRGVSLTFSNIVLWATAAVVLRIAAQSVLGLYRVSWYLFTFRDGTRLGAAWVCATIPLVAWFVVVAPFSVGKSGFEAAILESLFSLIFLGAVRGFARAKLELGGQRALGRVPVAAKRALVVGAGQAAMLAIRDLKAHPEVGYNVVGLIDDDASKWGLEVEGIPVLGGIDSVALAVETVQVDCIVLAMPSLSRSAMRPIVEHCHSTRIPVYTVPSLSELLAGRMHVSHIRPVKIEDLLGRSENLLKGDDWNEVEERFRGKRIMVTGAGGSIGSELCRQLCRLDPTRLIMVENNENNLFDIDNIVRAKIGTAAVVSLTDVRDEARMREVFVAHRPDVVFHAAAYKHVPMMELHPRDAILNNVLGTRVVARLAHEVGASHFVQVSTDKAVNPTNVMGASKRIAEMVVQSLARRSATKFSCVRFGNVLGSRGSVIHTFRQQIEAGGPITVTDPDVTRFFMTIPEAVRLVIQAGAHGNGGELFLLDMGEPVKIVDLAREMIRLTGHSEDEIPLRFIGLRPGEKLYEELLLSDEGTRPSGLDKVFLAASCAIDERKVNELIELLVQAANSGDGTHVRQILLSAGIGYRPSEEERQRDREALAARGASAVSMGAQIQAISSGLEPGVTHISEYARASRPLKSESEQNKAPTRDTSPSLPVAR